VIVVYCIIQWGFLLTVVQVHADQVSGDTLCTCNEWRLSVAFVGMYENVVSWQFTLKSVDPEVGLPEVVVRHGWIVDSHCSLGE
jgi:hypothetical protein